VTASVIIQFECSVCTIFEGKLSTLAMTLLQMFSYLFSNTTSSKRHLVLYEANVR